MLASPCSPVSHYATEKIVIIIIIILSDGSVLPTHFPPALPIHFIQLHQRSRLRAPIPMYQLLRPFFLALCRRPLGCLSLVPQNELPLNSTVHDGCKEGRSNIHTLHRQRASSHICGKCNKTSSKLSLYPTCEPPYLSTLLTMLTYSTAQGCSKPTANIFSFISSLPPITAPVR